MENRVDLGSLVEPIRGVSYQPEDLLEYESSNSITLLRSNNIQEEGTNLDEIQIVPEHKVAHSQLLKFNDVLVCMSNGSRRLVGKSSIFKFEDGRYCVGAFCAAFRTRSNHEPAFIPFLFKSIEFQKQINITLAGSAINNLKISEVLNFRFQIPPLPQQKKIAKILCTVDAQIEATEKLIAKYEMLKEGLLHDLFTRGIDTQTGKLRPHLKQAPHLYKNSPLGLIPKEWEVKSVGRLIKEGLLLDIQDGNHGELHPKSDDFVDEGIPFVMASDISKGKIDLVNCKKISVETFKKLRIGFSKSGDVLLSHKASIGFVALVESEIDELMLTPQVTYYRVIDKITLSNLFLYHFFQSQTFQSPLEKLSKQSTRDYIGITMQKSLNLILPSIEEQNFISQRVAVALEQIRVNEKELTKLQTLKKGLMQDLLGGKKEV